MYRLLEKLFNIRRSEILVTLLMLGYIYLLLVTYYFLKPVRDGLFLAKISWTQLPVVFILIAIIAVPVNQLHSVASRRLRLNSLINSTILFFIATLVIMRVIVGTGTIWAMYAFYIWVSIYGVLATSQFWLFSNAVYSPTQAKRLFVLLNLGAIIGAFTGGEVTSYAIKTFGIQTENLLFFCMGFLIVCIFLMNIAWTIKKREIEEERVPVRKREQPKENLAQIFRTIKSSRHLSLIVGIIAMTMATASFVDVQFKGIVQEAFSDDNARTAFFGAFYGRLSLISLLLQLFFSYRILRFLGVGGIITFLPIGLVFGSSILLFMPFVPLLWAGVILRGSDGAFKYSFDKTGRELLFLPVPLEIKKRTKIFIDVIVDRWFRGVAGGLLLLFTLVLGFSIRELSIVVFVLLAIWLFFIALIRKEYVNAFRRALEKRDIDLSELRMNIAGASTVNTLIEALKSENERQIVYALDMLSSVKDVDFTPYVVPLLQHPSKEVRLGAIKLLKTKKNEALKPEFEKLIQEKDLEIQLEAMRFLCMLEGENRKHFMKRFLEQKNPVLKATALVCISEEGVPVEQELIGESVIESLINTTGDEGELCRIQTARALGNLQSKNLYKYLLNLLEDPSPAVVRESLASIGSTNDREFVPVLMRMFTQKQYRKETRDAFAAYGSKVIGTLSDYLHDTTIDINVRYNIPSVLSQIPTQDSVNTLLDSLDNAVFMLKRRIIKAINKLHSRFPDLQINQQKVDSAFISETKTYYEILQILNIYKRKNDGEAANLLRRALEETLDRNLEQIFRLLGLRYKPDDIFFAYLGITSSKKMLRDNAIEFLDNVLGRNQKKYLFPILDRDTDEIAIRQGQHMFEIKEMSIEESFEYLLTGDNIWLKTCAIYFLKDFDSAVRERMSVLLSNARNEPDPFVQETANLVLHMKQEH